MGDINRCDYTARDARIAAENAEKERQAQIAATPPPVAQSAPVAAPAVSGSCSDWISRAGVSDVANALILINRESGCNPNSVNASSGACGIPQALPCSKLGTSDPVAQIVWMQSYVFGRYGSWSNAVAHSNATRWY